MTKFNTATITIEEIKAAPTSELLELYNEISGEDIKKFSDRKTAERRTWNMVQRLAPNEDIRETILKGKEPKDLAKAKKEKPGKRDDYENRVIKVLVKENPKRVGSRAHKKFGILMDMDGRTVAEYKKKEGTFPTLDMEKGWPATEIRWSLALGLVKLTPGETASRAA